uniref:LysM domain-containing protein n=1 Tax=Salix viminalis TaxID=40686 RepID=A0A6N2K377_SALVM
MAFHNFLPGLLITLLATLLAIVFSSDDYTNSQNMYPFTCSDSEDITICNLSLYHTNYDGLQKEQLASIYGVSPSRIISISSASRQDYLVTVPCSCKNINGNVGYFYDAIHNVSQGEMFFNVSAQIFNGQAWWVEDEARLFNPGYNFSMHLLCGCTRSKSQIVVTYNVQLHDTLSDISSRLSSTAGGIQSMNINLIKNPSSINVDWVLFVPTGSIPASRKAFESEEIVIFSLEEIEEATKSFAKTKKIGEGGYGCCVPWILARTGGCSKEDEINKSMSFRK